MNEAGPLIAVAVVALVVLKVAAYLWETVPVAIAGGLATAVAVGTSTSSVPAGALSGLLAAFVLYFLSTIRSPHTNYCWWCEGKPKHTDGTGHNFRMCWWCGGRSKERLGTRLRRRHRDED